MELPKYLRMRRGILELRSGKKWVSWNAYHSKLSAYVLGKGENWPFKKDSKILYLGAAEGNTVGFLSKVCQNGEIIAIDISLILGNPEDFEFIKIFFPITCSGNKFDNFNKLSSTGFKISSNINYDFDLIFFFELS